jgi:4'-phosphopantetheinyl transferase EntD
MAGTDVDDEDLASIVGTLRRLAFADVRVGARRITDGDELTLHAAELASITTAAPVRRREFASGRVLLRQLLGRDVVIPASPDRRPTVPHDSVVSLAHDRQVVVAAVAPATAVVALGIDIEPMRSLERDIIDVVVRPDDIVSDPLLAFVLKEASYKAWSTTGGRMLDHHDVLISAEPPSATSSAFVASVLPDGTKLHGRYASSGDAWLALVAVRA